MGAGNSRSTAITVALIGAAAAIIVGYWQFHRSSETDQHPRSLQVTARVVDEATRDGIGGAKVQLDGIGVPPTIYTDSEGLFSVSVDGGVLRIRVKQNGYEPYDRTIDITQGLPVVDIRLHRFQNDPAHKQQAGGAASDSSDTVASGPNDQQVDGVAFKLDGCAAVRDSLRCSVKITAVDRDRRLLLWGKSRIVANSGDEAVATVVRLLANESRRGRHSAVSANLARGVPINGYIEFVRPTGDTLPLLELVTSVGQVQFRNVPIAGH